MNERALPPPLPLEPASPIGAAVGEASSHGRDSLDITQMAESIPPGSRGDAPGGFFSPQDGAHRASQEDEEWELPISEIQEDRAPDEAPSAIAAAPPPQGITFTAHPDADVEWELPVSEIQDDDGPASLRTATVESAHHTSLAGSVAASAAPPPAAPPPVVAPPPVAAPAPVAPAPAPPPAPVAAAPPPPAAPAPAPVAAPAAATPASPASPALPASASAPAEAPTPTKLRLSLSVGDLFHGDEHRFAGSVAAAFAAATGALLGILAASRPAPPTETPTTEQAVATHAAPKPRHARKSHVAKTRAAARTRAPREPALDAGAPMGDHTDGIDLAELRRVLEKARRGSDPAPAIIDPHTAPSAAPSAKPPSAPKQEKPASHDAHKPSSHDAHKAPSRESPKR
jgi:hypothetical protein